VIYTPVDPRRSPETLRAICDGVVASRRGGAAHKPVLACVVAGHGRPQPLDAAGERVPSYAFPENAARALARAAAYAEWRAEPPALFWTFEDIRVDEATAVCRQAIAARGGGWLTSDEVGAVLGAFGVPVAAGMVARSAEEAVASAHL